ncbi:MAG TPA: hypothetical protein VF866_07545 [Xanthobacteraceae bacterium]
MRTFFKSLLLFALIFLAAYVTRITVVPNVVSIADGEQPGWQVQVAFIITSVQNIGLIGMALVMLVAASSRLKSLILPLAAALRRPPWRNR